MRKIYLDNPEKRRAAQRKYNAKPEAKKRRAAYDKAYKAKKKKERGAVKPKKAAAAKLPPKRSRLQPIEIIGKSPEWIVRNWDRIA